MHILLTRSRRSYILEASTAAPEILLWLYFILNVGVNLIVAVEI